MSSCSNQHRYHDRFEMLYQKASTSADKHALNELIHETNSRSFWERFYAFLFLGNLAVNYEKQLESDVYDEILDILVSGIDDSEPEIQRIVIERLKRTGKDGIRRGFDKLLKIVSECREDDVGWFSAEALAIPVSEIHTELAVKTLVEALSCEPPAAQKVPGAPQLRQFALRALVDLIKASGIDPDGVLVKARGGIVDPVFMGEVERILSGIKETAKGFSNGLSR